MPTPNFNLPLYGPGDTAELDTLLNGQSSAIDTALLASEGRIVGTSTQRLALVAPRLKEGLRFYETNTNREWFYDGTNWLSQEQGMYLIQPTAALGAGATLQADGSVTWTGVTANTYIGASGVFSSRFKFYKVFYSFESSTSAAWAMRFAAGGSLLTTSNYNNIYNIFNAGTVTGGTVSAQTVSTLASINTAGTYGEFLIMDPNDASKNTAWQMNGTGGTIPFSASGRYSQNVAVDGIALGSAAGSGVGYMRVLGVA